MYIVHSELFFVLQCNLRAATPEESFQFPGPASWELLSVKNCCMVFVPLDTRWFHVSLALQYN